MLKSSWQQQWDDAEWQQQQQQQHVSTQACQKIRLLSTLLLRKGVGQISVSYASVSSEGNAHC
jgi:hypothetical protein